MNPLTTYFDTAAATPTMPEVAQKMHAVQVDSWPNPSGIHSYARRSSDMLTAARKQLAMYFGAQPNEMISTAGATEANATMIRGLLDAHPEGTAIVSAADHPSVLSFSDDPRYTRRIHVCDVDNRGRIDLDKMASLLTNTTILISAVMVASESGVLQPIKELSVMVLDERKKRESSESDRLPICLHSDASQAAFYYDLSVSRLGLDAMTVNPAKAGGPKRSAFLYLSRTVNLLPLLVGGGQEFGRRSGTEALDQYIGSVEALKYARADRKRASNHVQQLRNYFEKTITKLFDVTVVGVSSKRAPHISGLLCDGIDGERLAMKLDEVGFAIATGSACSENGESYSSYLRSIGLSDRTIQSYVRVSFHPGHTSENVDSLIAAMQQAAAEVRGL